MLPINRDLAGKLNWFASNEGAKALETLADALWDFNSSQCAELENTALYRSQGAAQLSKWLKTLPKGLRDASNGTS